VSRDRSSAVTLLRRSFSQLTISSCGERRGARVRVSGCGWAAAGCPSRLTWISAKLGLLADLRASTCCFSSFLDSAGCGSASARGAGAGRANGPCLYTLAGGAAAVSSRARLRAAGASAGSSRNTFALAPPVLGLNLAARAFSRRPVAPLPLAEDLPPTVPFPAMVRKQGYGVV